MSTTEAALPSDAMDTLPVPAVTNTVNDVVKPAMEVDVDAVSSDDNPTLPSHTDHESADEGMNEQPTEMEENKQVEHVAPSTELHPEQVEIGQSSQEKTQEEKKEDVETPAAEADKPTEVAVSTTEETKMEEDEKEETKEVTNTEPAQSESVEMESQEAEEQPAKKVEEEKVIEEEKKGEEAEPVSAEPESEKQSPAVVKTPEAAKSGGKDAEEVPVAATPATVKRGRGRAKKTAPTESGAQATPAGPPGRGRKRTVNADTPAATSTAKRSRAATKVSLSYTDFITWQSGSRVLTCGEGEQLGHPGRTTTKKPRKVDIVEEEELIVQQVVAGGVHSLFLTADGDVYSCGINEKGTVPADGVEKEGSTDEFTKITFSDELVAEGKIVMLAAGASFAGALTDKGSVIAWGNLRDAGGKIDVHDQLTAMQQAPIIVVHHKKGLVIVKIVAGENHLVMLTDDGRVLTFGDGSMGQLGRSSRVERIRSQYMAADSTASLMVHLVEKRGAKRILVKNVFAGGFWTSMLSADNRVFVCGLNNFGHLGIPIEEEEKGNGDSSGDAQPGEEDSRELRIALPKESPAFSGVNWTHMEGVQHIVARNEQGEVFAIGKNTDNALGLGTWTGNDDQTHWRYDKLEKVQVDGESVGVTAQLASSIAWTKDGVAYSWGCDTSGQLGLGLKDDDDKIVPKPEKIESAHLNEYHINQVSIADNHAIFLAQKEE